jgi:hypothetical protein
MPSAFIGGIGCFWRPLKTSLAISALLGHLSANGMLQQEQSLLAAGHATVYLEAAALRRATTEPQFIGPISSVIKIAFNMVEHDAPGNGLYT